MQKLKELTINKIVVNLFILLIIMIPIQIIIGYIKFYSLSYQSEVLKDFLYVYMLDKLIFYLPAIFITTLFYTINSSFPDSIKKSMNIDNKAIFSFYSKIGIVFVIFNILVIEFLSTTLLLQKEKLELKNKFVKMKNEKLKNVTTLYKEAEKYLQKKDYYKSLELYQEILIILPNYPLAKDRIKLIEEKLIIQKENKFKSLLQEGINNFNNRKYKKALKFLERALKINPNSKEALKYYNLSLQELNIKQKQLIKDRYSYLIILYKEETPEVLKRRRIYQLMKKGRTEFINKNYLNAKNIFKQILLEDTTHYGANYYLSLINQRLSQITYFTTINDKIIKSGTFYFITKDEIVVPEKLAKSDLNEYIFFNTTFYKYKDNRLIKKLTKKYGYYNHKKKKFEFINSFITDKKPYYVKNINPETMWYLNDIIDSPENFPFYKIINFFNYFVKKNKSIISFAYIIITKINFYLILILLFIFSLSFGLAIRRKTGTSKIGYISFIFLPILAIIFNKIFINLFYFTKRIIKISIMHSILGSIISLMVVYILMSIVCSKVKS